MRATRWLAAAAAAVAIVVPLGAFADGNVQVFAGGQFDFANYVFFGATFPIHPDTSDSGIAARVILDTGGYNYDGGTLGTVKANFGGGQLDAVYQLNHHNFWADFGVGLNDAYTGLMPYDPNNILRGEQTEVRLSLDGGTVTGPWRVDYAGYYGTRLNDYQALLDGTHSISPAWRLGLQVYSEGNPTYRAYQVGPYAGVGFAKGSELQFSAGKAWESGFVPRAYLKALIVQTL